MSGDCKYHRKSNQIFDKFTESEQFIEEVCHFKWHTGKVRGCGATFLVQSSCLKDGFLSENVLGLE